MWSEMIGLIFFRRGIIIELFGVGFRRQGKEFVTQALAEFVRLELAHKASEARELLKGLMS